jgi:hypothetical protein
MDEGKSDKTGNVLRKLLATRDTVIYGAWYNDVCKKYHNFTLSHWNGTNTDNQKLSQSRCNPAQIQPFGAWYRHHFGDDLRIQVVSFTSIFAVSKRHIHQRPRDFYETLLAELEKSSNPEEGHFVERAWVAIFHPLPSECLFAPRPPPPSRPRVSITASTKGLGFGNLLEMYASSNSSRPVIGGKDQSTINRSTGSHNEQSRVRKRGADDQSEIEESHERKRMRDTSEKHEKRQSDTE